MSVWMPNKWIQRNRTKQHDHRIPNDNGVSIWHRQWKYYFNKKSECLFIIFIFIIYINKTAIIVYCHLSILKYFKLPVIVFRLVKMDFKPNNVSASSHFFNDIIHLSIQAPHNDDKKVLVSTMLSAVGCRLWCFQQLFALCTIISSNPFVIE